MFNTLKIAAPLTCLLCLLYGEDSLARAEKFRVIWQGDASTTATIGWHQASGANPTLLLDINDYDKNANEYGLSRRPDRIQLARGMNNHFVRLTGLRPNTTYYFLVKDSEGLSRQLFFTTAPNSPNERLSIIAGGDSRNHRDARQDANRIVAKLRPHCVMFGGDFTASDIAEEWLEWMDDWQLTIAADGRITPIIPTRGNHEESNQSIIDLFDVQTKGIFYGTNLGGDLLRVYTLNTLIPVSGEQQTWLEADLRSHTSVTWRIAQYHHPMRPHTEKKPEKNDQVVNWAPLFLKYKLQLAVECDAHVVKSTWPIRPDNGPGSTQGFIRDDEEGTTYIGEGCWGAPLRDNNDDKPWTRASGSFNTFHWIFIDKSKMEVRFVQTDGAEQVADINPKNIFSAPRGLSVWSPETGDVISILNPQASVPPAQEGDILAAREGKEKPPVKDTTPPKAQAPMTEAEENSNWEACPQLMCDPKLGSVKFKYEVEQQGNVVIRLINLKLQEVTRLEIPNQAAGEHLKTLEMSHLPPGRYLAVVKAGKKVLKRYRILKKE